MAKDIKIEYTPLHGTGNLPVRRVLKRTGFENVYVVKERGTSDGNFPTVAYQTRNLQRHFELALKLAKEVDADIVLDRSGRRPSWRILQKTQDRRVCDFHRKYVRMLICRIYFKRKRQSERCRRILHLETIVTTDMAKAMATSYGVALIEVLIGFKYIGEQIKWFEQNHSPQLCIRSGGELWMLSRTYARDKDARVAVMICARWLPGAKNMEKHCGMP